MPHTDILCITHSSWDGPKRIRHNLMREYSKRGHRVVFVEAWLTWIKLFRGTQYWRFAFNFLRPPIQTDEGITIASVPPLFPGGEWFEFIGKLNWNIVRWWLKRSVLRKLSLKKPRLFIFSNTAANLVGKFDESLSIYFCNDPFKQIFEHPSAYANLDRMENELTSCVDVVFAVSEKLVEERKRFNPNTFLIPHAVNIELFGQAMDSSLAIPYDIARCPKPVFGHVGVLNVRIDTDLMQELARMMPEASFVFVGPIIEVNAEYRAQLESLKKFKNIFFLGDKKEEELPAYLKGIDVCMIPYVRNDFTKYIKANAKFFQFVASGRPVVSTIGPADFDEDIVITATAPGQFAEALRKAISLKTKEHLLKRKRLAAQHTYGARVDEMESIFETLKR